MVSSRKSSCVIYEYNPDKHQRRSIRLRGYDYTQEGIYFITIYVNKHINLLGHVVYNEMILSDAGRMVESTWDLLPERFPNISVDNYVVMPNHFHGLIFIVGAPLVGAQDALVDDFSTRAGTRPAL